MPGHDLNSIKCEPTTEDDSQPTALDMWYRAESNLQRHDNPSSHLLQQLHGNLDELAPAPAGPAATPVDEHQPSPTEASLATLQPAPVGNTMGTSIIDMHVKMMNVKEVADSADFVPLMAVKEEQTSEGEQQQSSDDTSDSAPEHPTVGRGSPKAWSPQDMDSALEALRSHNMTLTKASATFGIPSTTLWQRAHRLGIDTPKKDGASKSWSEDDLKMALQALRAGTISANKASKAYGIPSSTLYKIARREGIRLAAPFNAAPTAWRRADLARALAAVRAGAAVQRAASHYGIPTGTLYGRCKREGIELSRSNPTPWSEGAMEEALEAVRVGQMSINQAAIHFNLPYSSLYGRFKRCKYQVPQDIRPQNPMDFSEQVLDDRQFSSDMNTLDDLHRTYTLADVLEGVQSRTHAGVQSPPDDLRTLDEVPVHSRIQADARYPLDGVDLPQHEVQSRTQSLHSTAVNVHSRTQDVQQVNEVQSRAEVAVHSRIQADAQYPLEGVDLAQHQVQSRTQSLHSTAVNVHSRLESDAQYPLDGVNLAPNQIQSRTQSLRRGEEVQSRTEMPILADAQYPLDGVDLARRQEQSRALPLDMHTRTHDVQQVHEVHSGTEVRTFSGVRQAPYALEPCAPAYCIAS